MIIDCKKCAQKLRIKKTSGDKTIRVTCPKCSFEFEMDIGDNTKLKMKQEDNQEQKEPPSLFFGLILFCGGLGFLMAGSDLPKDSQWFALTLGLLLSFFGGRDVYESLSHWYNNLTLVEKDSIKAWIVGIVIFLCVAAGIMGGGGGGGRGDWQQYSYFL